jgi:hypothetical protein
MDYDWGGVLDDEAYIDYWSPRVAKVLTGQHITKLRIRGWKAADLEPLTPFRDQIERIDWDVSDDDDTPDLSALGRMRRLKQLYLSGGLEQVDFSGLRKLTSLSVSARHPVFGNLRTCGSLRVLSITNSGLRDLTPLTGLKRLRELVIGEAPLQALTGIGELRNLRRLALSQVPLGSLNEIAQAGRLHDVYLYMVGRLESIAPLKALPALRTLNLGSCRKVRDLDSIGELRGLESLELHGVVVSPATLGRLCRLKLLHLQSYGRIPSIAFVRDLRGLERLYFLEGTVVEDGDMSPLLDLPKLKKILFDTRRNYSHTLEEVQRRLAKRRRT